MRQAILILGLLITAFFTPILWNLEPGHVAMEMSVEGFRQGTISHVYLFVNNMNDPPVVRQIIGNERFVYDFPIYSNHISFLRINLVDLEGLNNVQIYSLALVRNGNTIYKFPLSEISVWQKANISRIHLEPDGVVIVPGNSNPYIFSETAPISLTFLPNILFIFAKIPWSYCIAFMIYLAMVLCLMLGVLSGEGRIDAGVGVGVVVAILMASVVIPHNVGGALSVAQSVSDASFYGYRKYVDYISLWLVIFLPVAVSMIFWLFVGRSRGTGNVQDGTPITDDKSGNLTDIIFLAFLTAALFLYLFPDLKAVQKGIETDVIPDNWDYDVEAVWRYFFQAGKHFHKDLFYPYGVRYVTLLPFPYGTLISFSEKFINASIQLISVYLLTGRSKGQTVLVFGTVFLLFASGVDSFFTRYGFIISIVVSYMAVDRRQVNVGYSRILFWIAFAGGVLFDFSCVVYALIGILSVEFINILFVRKKLNRDFFHNILSLWLVPCLVISVLGFILWHRGELKGFVDTIFFGSQWRIYGATHEVGVDLWLRIDDFVTKGIVFWVGALQIGLGLYGAVTQRDQQRQNISRIMLALGIAFFFLLFKQITRPHMGAQLIPLSTFGLIFYLIDGLRWMNLPQRVVVMLLIATLAGSAWKSGLVKKLPLLLLSGKSRVFTGLLLTYDHVVDPEKTSRLVRKSFAPEKYANRSKELLLTGTALMDHLVNEGNDALFVLGEAQLLYILSGSGQAPYFTEYFTRKPLNNELRVLDWVIARKPIVVVDTSRIPLKGVSNPFTLNHVVSHYVPEKWIGEYGIMKLRSPGEEIPVEQWREKLGAEVDVGYLATCSSIQECAACEPDAIGNCSELLMIRLTDMGRQMLRGAIDSHEKFIAKHSEARGSLYPLGFFVPISVGDQQFQVIFRPGMEKALYVINMDRIWFWGGLRGGGLRPVLGHIGPELEVTLMKCRVPPNILY